MTLLALALDRDTEDRLLADIVEHGHVIVARPANVRELLAAIDRHAPEALIVGATGGTLTAELLAASDSMGIRVVALAATVPVLVVVALVLVAVRGDGLGHRRPPSSRAEWSEGSADRLPSHPYGDTGR